MKANEKNMREEKEEKKEVKENEWGGEKVLEEMKRKEEEWDSADEEFSI
jgi:hypothetical protein